MTSSLNNCLTLIRNEFSWLSTSFGTELWFRLTLHIRTEAWKMAPKVRQQFWITKGGKSAISTGGFFFQSSSKVQRKLRNFVAVATGSRIPDDYPTPDQLSEFDRFGEFPSFKTSQVFGKNRSEESIHHGKEDDSAKWWVTMVPILGCPGKCRTSQGKWKASTTVESPWRSRSRR